MLGFASPLELVLVASIVAVGSALQGSVGFGLALMTAPLLEWIDPRLVPGPLILAVTLLLALTAFREREAIDLKGLGWILLGRAPGTVLGALALRGLTASALTVSLGVLVLLAVGISLLHAELPRTRPLLAIAGLISGLMGTTAALGGPAVAVLYQRERGELVRSTLASFFLIGAVMSLAALAWVGRLGGVEAKLAVGMLPGIAGGFFMSKWTGAWLDAGRTRFAILLVAGLSGFGAVVRGLW